MGNRSCNLYTSCQSQAARVYSMFWRPSTKKGHGSVFLILGFLLFSFWQLPLVLPGHPRVSMCSRAGDDVTHQRRAVLWDIDGTLVDSTDLAWSSTNLVLKQNGFPGVSSEEYKEATRLTTPKRLALHATKDVNAEIGIKLAEEFDQHYVQLVSPTTVPLFPGLARIVGRFVKRRYPSWCFKQRLWCLRSSCVIVPWLGRCFSNSPGSWWCDRS